MSAAALTGWCLVIGSVVFGIGAGNPALMRAWTAPRDEFLRTVARRKGAWRLTSLLFVAATLFVAAGFAAVPGLVTDDVANTIAAAAATAFGVGAVLWILTLLHRLAVVPATALAFAGTGVVDPAGELLDRLMGACFQAFIVVGAVAVAAAGLALCMGGLVPVLLGWGVAGLSAVIVVGLLVTGDMPPFTLFIAPLAFGIALQAH